MQEWFNTLEQRERYLVIFGAIFVLLALFYLLVVDPLYSGVSERRASITEKQALLGWMEVQAAALPKAGASKRGARGNSSPMVTFGRAVTTAKLDPYLKETRPSGDNGVRARFEGAPFDQLIQLIGQLNSQNSLEISTAAVERTRDQGTIDARITLEVPGS